MSTIKFPTNTLIYDIINVKDKRRLFLSKSVFMYNKNVGFFIDNWRLEVNSNDKMEKERFLHFVKRSNRAKYRNV